MKRGKVVTTGNDPDVTGDAAGVASANGASPGVVMPTAPGDASAADDSTGGPAGAPAEARAGGRTAGVSTGLIAVEEARASEALAGAFRDLGHGERRIDLRAIPFAGTWGVATSACQALASELIAAGLAGRGEAEGLSKKELKRLVNEEMPERSRAIAERVADHVRGGHPEFAGVEAANGYVNISFDAGTMASRLVNEILSRGEAYGRGEPRPERVMVEHSQLNTHKAAHIGHLRNICLGVSVTNLLAAAGYPTEPATYIGDIGRHVIQCLWCYERFHRGQEPEDILQRGRWLGELYAEADRRLRFRKEALDLLRLLATEDPIFVLAIDRMLKKLVHKQADGEDIAYLLGRTIHAQEIKAEQLRQDDVIPRYWPIVGEQLRLEAEDPTPRVVEEGQPEPTMTPAERLARWEVMAADMDEWWGKVEGWEAEVKETFQRWERKEPAFVSLWEETREWSMVGLRHIFAELGDHIQHWFTESAVEEPGRAIVQDLLARGIAEVSDGLPVVKIDEKLGLEQETYRTLPILRSDGTTLYSTKDLALTRQKYEDYGIDISIWVVDVRQSLYFDQIFKVMELSGFEKAAEAIHLGYEFVSLPDGAISSRKGTAPLYEDIRDAVVARARTIIEEKNPDLTGEARDRVAWQVGIGSLKYAMLARDITKVVVFDLDEALSFDGHAAPYIQYAYARASRILDRAEITPDAILASAGDLTFTGMEPSELTLLQQLATFPDEIQRAAAEYRPLLITNYVYEVAKAFNDFYHACPVLQSGEPTRSARLALVAATRQTLANGLAILGIDAPEEM